MAKKKVTAKERVLAKNLRNYEARVSKRRERYFLEPYKALAKGIESRYKKSGYDDIEKDLDEIIEEYFDPKLQQALFTVHTINIKEFVEYFVENFKRTLNLDQMQDIESKLLRDYLNKYTGETVTRVSRTTKKILKNRITEHKTAGMSFEDMVREIVSETKGEIGKKRAGIIARTETSKAINSTNFETASKSGLKKKKWLHAGGGITDRPSHIQVHGIEIEISEKFKVPGHGKTPAVEMRFPKDPEVRVAGHIVHCYCQIFYL